MTQSAAAAPSNETKAMLRRLASNDDRWLRAVMAPAPEHLTGAAPPWQPLDRRTRVLVRLAALLAVGAPTTSLRWAVDLASTAGVGDDVMLDTLLAAAPVTGSAALVSSAPRLALALGLDVAPERPDLL